MEEFKIYSVSDRYISYLRDFEPNVYSNKEDNRSHTRKYVGIVLDINDYHYFVPLSSPKETDYQVAGEGKVIKKSIIPIIRIIEKTRGVKELKGTLRLSHMIPVPEEELVLYDLDNEEDTDYKALVTAEMIYIRKNSDKIRNNAEILYKQKAAGDESIGYLKAALDYKKLEKLHDEYKPDNEEDSNG